MIRKILPFAVIIAAASFVFAGASLPAVGSPMKTFYLPDFNAQQEGRSTFVSLKTLAAKNKVVVFSFFYSSCKNCKNEIPAVQKIVSEYTNKGVALLFVCAEPVDVNNGESWTTDGVARVQKVITEWNITYPIVDDHYLNAATAYGVFDEKTRVIHAPALFMVSGSKIQFAHSGWEGEKSAEEVEAAIKRLLK
ncbi:MAG: TlpA disulfide reductase family protein [Spirochaetota bacterium]